MAEERSERAQVMLNAETMERVDELAGRLKMSRSQFLSVLIEQGLDDNEWIIKIVSSRYLDPVRDAVRGWKKKKRSKKPSTT